MEIDIKIKDGNLKIKRNKNYTTFTIYFPGEGILNNYDYGTLPLSNEDLKPLLQALEKILFLTPYE